MKALLILGIVLALCCPVTASAQTLEQAKKAHIEKTLKTAEGQKIKAAVEKYSKEYKLDKHYVYLDLNGFKETPDYDKVTAMLNDRINELKNQNSGNTLIRGIEFDD